MRIAVELPELRGQLNRAGRQILNRLSGFAVLILTQRNRRNRARINMNQTRALNHFHALRLGKFLAGAKRCQLHADVRNLRVFGGDLTQPV